MALFYPDYHIFTSRNVFTRPRHRAWLAPQDGNGGDWGSGAGAWLWWCGWISSTENKISKKICVGEVHINTSAFFYIVLVAPVSVSLLKKMWFKKKKLVFLLLVFTSEHWSFVHWKEKCTGDLSNIIYIDWVKLYQHWSFYGTIVKSFHSMVI